MVRTVWNGESLMSSWEGKCLPKKLTLKIISANVNKTFDLLFFVYFVVVLFYLSGWLSAWSYSQGPQLSPVIPNILG